MQQCSWNVLIWKIFAWSRWGCGGGLASVINCSVTHSLYSNFLLSMPRFILFSKYFLMTNGLAVQWGKTRYTKEGLDVDAPHWKAKQLMPPRNTWKTRKIKSYRGESLSIGCASRTVDFSNQSIPTPPRLRENLSDQNVPTAAPTSLYSIKTKVIFSSWVKQVEDDYWNASKTLESNFRFVPRSNLEGLHN